MKRFVFAVLAVVLLFSSAFAETVTNPAFSCSVPDGMTYAEEEYGTNGTLAATLTGYFEIRISWEEGLPVRVVYGEDEDGFVEEDDSVQWNEENPEENLIFLDHGEEPEEGTETEDYLREAANTTFVCRKKTGTQDGRRYLQITAIGYYEGRNYLLWLFLRTKKGMPQDKSDEQFSRAASVFDEWITTFTCIP